MAYRYHPTLLGLAQSCDVLMVVASGGPETRHIVNQQVLEALGPDGIVINVGRGTVIDEAALVAALRERKILSAGLDVFEDEPRVPAELIAMEHVVLLPHVGSASVHTRNAMGQLVVDNLVSWFGGKGAVTPVPECQALAAGKGQGLKSCRRRDCSRWTGAPPRCAPTCWARAGRVGARQQPWGILHLPEGGFAAALQGVAGDWLALRPGLPAIASGMVGSAQGWREAPYAEVPADAAAWPGAAAAFRSLPGVSDCTSCLACAADGGRPDVMRGEETQIVGLLTASPQVPSARLVLPGTHSKWVRVDAAAPSSTSTPT